MQFFIREVKQDVAKQRTACRHSAAPKSTNHQCERFQKLTLPLSPFEDEDDEKTATTEGNRNSLISAIGGVTLRTSLSRRMDGHGARRRRAVRHKVRIGRLPARNRPTD